MFITFIIYLLFFRKSNKDLKIIFFSFSSLLISFFIINFFLSKGIIEIDMVLKERLTIFNSGAGTSTTIHFDLIKNGIYKSFNDIKIFLFGFGHGNSYKIIEGIYWSGSKYGNLHSQYLI